jgi:CRP-like cAMP-binding protein
MEKLIHFFISTNLVTLHAAEEIAGQFSKKIFEKNDFFLKQGRLADEYLFLESGFIRSFAFDVNNNDVTTNFYSSNQVVFEVASFFNRTISQENFQALSDCEGWSITYQQLNTLFHTLPAFRDFGRHILVKGFSALKSRMLSMISDTAEERYQKLIQANPEIFFNAPLKNIASYIGVTDTSLSRIRREFSKK